MPSNVTFKAMNAIHRLVLKASGGRLGTTTAGMPVIELTTVGRKSGQTRSVMLTTPVSVGANRENIVLVASRGGDDVHPAWYLNLLANPMVTVVQQNSASEKTKVAMRARTATSEERTILWPKITAAYSGYAQYQTKTTRQIPVIILEPARALG
jgi:deazaflavin-dependent oxidoreductase (nitroreductase family)